MTDHENQALTHGQKKRIKQELLEACHVAIQQYMSSIRGAQWLGAGAELKQHTSTSLEIKVPKIGGPSYFEITVKEKL